LAPVLDRDSKVVLEPYLSLVVTARNDDHGGNLLGRMQIFVNGWLAHARRHNIPSELIIVEWNPPADRPPLAEALRWPVDFGPCEVRFITVPPEIHSRYQHGANLPLYQMIGKNVGIRRARGRFILATNIDILFSDELAAFLGSRQLKTDRMYRIDRYDAMSDVPADAPLEEQLAYCRSHLIRVNRREGTFEVTSDGGPVLSALDAASAGSGILFGPGWFSPERFGTAGSFRWAQEQAEILLDASPGSTTRLAVDLEPGPAAGGRPLDLEVLTDDGRSIARFKIDTRSTLKLTLPAPYPARLVFRALGNFASPNTNPRTLCFRVFSLARDIESGDAPNTSQATLETPSTRSRMLVSWKNLQYVIRKLAHGGPLISLTIPVSPKLQRTLKNYVDRGGLTGMLRGRTTQPAAEPMTTSAVQTTSVEMPLPVCCPDFLHTNGCGDFTLIAREHWFDLRGYPELDIFSMNIDSLFCFAAHYGGAHEEFLADPMRIYHIEHGSGSGWTPEGQQKLWERLAAKRIPVLENEDVLQWGAQMRRLNSPLIFNHEDWGLANVNLDGAAPESQAFRIDLDPAVLPSLRALTPALNAYADVHQAGPEIDAGLLAAARILAYTRPLSPYPEWRFDSDWDNPDIEFRMRRFIWTYFHNASRETLFRMKWHKALTIQINLGNDLSRPVFIGGCIDPNEFAFLDSVLRDGMVFVDAGANEGLYSLFASRCVGPSGRVVSFEPSQREFHRLSCNIQLNGLENVHAVQTALAETPGDLELSVADPSHAGQNTLGKFIYQVPLLRTERVSAQTLDGFAAESGLARLDVLKLDVEGAERRVLDGSRTVLRQMRPVILFEASDAALKEQGSSLPDLLEFLRSQEYRFYAPGHRTGVPIPADGDTRSDNMIAVPIERPKL
jgi:FkbM family methyltransferase